VRCAYPLPAERLHSGAIRRNLRIMSTGGPVFRLVVWDETAAARVGELDKLRIGGATVEITVTQLAPGETPAFAHRLESDPPLGVIARSEAEAFAAIANGADDACSTENLDLEKYLAFLDRVELRARHRRDAANRRAAVAHTEKLSAIGAVVAGVAHEVNNPLTLVVLSVDTIRTNVEPLLRAQGEIFRLAQRGSFVTAEEIQRLAELVQTGAPATELRKLLADATHSLATVQATVKDLRIFARAEDDERDESVFLPDLIDHVLRIAGAHLKIAASIEQDYGENLPLLMLPRSRIAQVLTNLLINAGQAISEYPRPVHRVRISTRCDDEAIAISIADTGPGIPSDIIERIFDPFFTTKRADGGAGGTGLGLSISRSILQQLGGDLLVESVHGEGATFIAIIPTEGRRILAETKKKKPDRDALPDMPKRPSVLVIDDDEAILRTIATALRGQFQVLLASEGQEAIDLLVSGSKPDALLCDVAMPVMDGPRFYRWLVENRPWLVEHTIFMSANVDGEPAVSFANVLGKPLLEKPMSRDRLISVLDRAAGTAARERSA
jgi:signal transduction histidine kinase/CheY-like chemotaxis protein